MPAIETRLAAAPDASGKALGGPGEDFSDQPATGDDFDHIMQATLAPQHQKFSERATLRTEANPPAGKSFPPDASTTGTKGHKSGDKISDGKVDDKKKRAADTAGTISADPTASAVALNTTDPQPAFLSLPLFLFGSFSIPVDATPPAAKTDTAEKNPAVPGSTSGTGASSLFPLPGKATAAAMPPVPNPAVPGSTGEAEKQAAKTTKTGTGDDQLVNGSKLEGKKVSLADPPKPASEPAADEPALEPDQRSGPYTIDKGQDFATANSLEQAAANAGTGVASMVSQMKNPQNTNKVAGLDVKVLPVGENTDASETNLPPQLFVTPVSTADNRGADLNFAFANGSNHESIAENGPVLTAVDLPSLTEARMRTLDRTQDMMALHAMRLVESTSNTLSVVIKPSVGTELSLELHQHPDGVEAQATLTRGDHQFLSQHWAELQQRMEQRGIKLAPLGGEMNLLANDNGHFQQQQASQEEAAQRASAFAEFAATGITGGATARLAVVHDGWESWA